MYQQFIFFFFIAKYYCFLWIYNNFGFFKAIYVFRDIYVSRFWLLQMKLWWAFTESLYAHMLSFLLVKCQGVEWLLHMVNVYITVWQSSRAILHSHRQAMRVEVPPHPCQHLVWLVFLVLAILMRVKKYLIMVLFHISLMTNVAEHIFMWLFGSTYLFWWNVYLNVSPIFIGLFSYHGVWDFYTYSECKLFLRNVVCK